LPKNVEFQTFWLQNVFIMKAVYRGWKYFGAELLWLPVGHVGRGWAYNWVKSLATCLLYL